MQRCSLNGLPTFQILVSSLTEEQLDRYEAFRRSKFPQAQIRKLVNGMTGVSPSANCCIVLCGKMIL